VTPAKGIFLSHAHVDRPLADLLRNTLVLGGVPESRIFYSSSRATGIPSGEDVRPYLQRNLREAGLVIELISEIFLARPMCLMELGGAWTLGTPTYPIVVPPLRVEVAAQHIGNVQMGILGRGSDIDDLFDELHDRLAKDVDILTQTTPWNRAIRNFKELLPSKLAAVRPAGAPATSRRPAVPGASPATVNREPESSAAEVESLDEITISNVSIVSTRQGRELHGETTNNDDVEHTAFVKATFYDAEGGIVGTESAPVNQLRPGVTKTFSMRPIPDHHHFKVQIDMLVGR
jgi:TIR domain